MRLLNITFLLAISNASPGFAKESTGWKPYNVPTHISTTQEIAEAPKDWSVSSEKGPNRLSSVSISEGVYDQEIKQKNKLILVWHLSGKSTDQFWITCGYQGTNIKITKLLPSGIKAFRVSYKTKVTRDGLPTIDSVEYK